jgi:hypothetical protein
MTFRPSRGVEIGAIFFITAAVVVACANSTTDYEIGEATPEAGPSFSNDIDSGDANAVGDAGNGLFNDGAPQVDATSCVPDAGGPGPVGRFCLPPTNNECDGQHDLPTYPANGTGGNGFDDDCDGLVDEGCSCDAAGITKTCYLVPASQTFAGKPVGWCASNAKGTVDCVKPSSEFLGTWSGQCRGAQPPYADDVCANGDFDCDGKDQNSKATDCSCKGDPVQCPTTALDTVPYPPPAALPLKVDASGWFLNPADVANASNWKWTLSGGDCDNILPHPTFSMFPTSIASSAVGTQIDTLGTNSKEHGYVATAPAVTSSIYPAFSLSGDYRVQGEFDLNGKHYSCQQKIQVRAPGIRVESCWDTEPQGVDLDLHVAQLTAGASCPQKGWSGTCSNQDCYYSNCKTDSPDWYPPTPSLAACQGWGSRTTGSSCNNPRLDVDANGTSGDCKAAQTNPHSTDFCGPENINIDNPGNGSRYAVGVKYFGGSAVSRTHVNVYCNGERVLSTGYNPVTGNDFPKLASSGGNTSGDFWKVAMITASVTPAGLACDVKPVPSQQPHAATDGSNAYCVDNTTRNTSDSAKYFTSGGSNPLDAEALCFH